MPGKTDTGDTTVVTETSATDGELTADELAEFEAGWDEGEEVAEKEFNADGSEKAPASDSEDATDENSETDEEDATEEDSTDKDSEGDKPKEDKEEQTEVEKADDTTEDKTTLSPEEQKRHNDEMAKARIAERDARIAAQKAEKEAQEASIERYLREAGDDDLELQQRQLNVEAFRIQQDKIAVNEDKLQAGIERAVASIDLFRTGSPEIQEELAKSLDDFERMYVKKNDAGKPVEVLGDVVQFLQAKAASIERIRATGATQQGKDKKNQQSRTVTPPVRAPKKAKSDPQLDAFDEEAGRY